MSYGLGYTPTEEDVRHMARLRMERVRVCLSGIPFDYLLRLYTFCLANYFIRGSKRVPCMEGIDHISETVEI